MRLTQCRNYEYKCDGTSLLELLIVLTILGVFVSLSAPLLKDSLVRARLDSSLTQLTSSLNYAREHAVYSGRSISLCAGIQSMECDRHGDWSRGWQAFFSAPDATPLKSDQLHHADIRFYKLQPTKPIIYTKMGFTPLSNTNFTICSTQLPYYQRKLFVSSYGRIRIAEETSNFATRPCLH